LIAAFFIQLLLLDHIKAAGSKPDLLLLLVVFFAIFFGPAAGAEAGFAAGLLKDAYSLDIFGVNIVLLSLMGFVVGILSPKLFRESKLTQSLLVLVSSVFIMTIHYFISSMIFKNSYTAFWDYLCRLILPSGFYTAVFSAFLFPILVGRYRLKENAEYL
jgi:rod shape-determining protein MreD